MSNNNENTTVLILSKFSDLNQPSVSARPESDVSCIYIYDHRLLSYHQLSNHAPSLAVDLARFIYDAVHALLFLHGACIQLSIQSKQRSFFTKINRLICSVLYRCSSSFTASILSSSSFFLLTLSDDLFFSLLLQHPRIYFHLQALRFQNAGFLISP